MTYSQALARVRALSQALLDRRLSSDRPVLILSGNGIEHGLLALAAMFSGVLYAPIAPAYSLQAKDYGTLGQIFERMRPGLVFAAEGAAFERALSHVMPKGVELVVSSLDPGAPASMRATPFAELEAARATSAVDDANARVGPDTMAKILFTSGSTGRPKGVINTQRMLCANQEMIRSVLVFLTEEPVVLCDWLPWNHTAGGNHNFGLVLFNGGTLYIDEGRPIPSGIETTVRNLREIAATAHFAVPRTYEALMPYLRADAELRERFFSRLKLLFYAAAGLSQRFFDELSEMAVQSCGEDILWMTGFGATETAPFALSTGPEGASSGVLGLPAPGMELKLAPVGEKIEARVRGPNITPGYFRDDELTRAAFDEEGFYRLGDAMRFVDPRRSGEGPRLRRAAGRGLQAVERHVGQRGAAALQDPRARGRLRAGRRDRRTRSRRRRRAHRPEPARRAPRCAPSCRRIRRRGRCWRMSASARGFRRCSTTSPARAPAAPRSSRGRFCSRSRRPSTRARSPTRDR